MLKVWETEIKQRPLCLWSIELNWLLPNKDVVVLRYSRLIQKKENRQNVFSVLLLLLLDFTFCRVTKVSYGINLAVEHNYKGLKSSKCTILEIFPFCNVRHVCNIQAIPVSQPCDTHRMRMLKSYKHLQHWFAPICEHLSSHQLFPHHTHPLIYYRYTLALTYLRSRNVCISTILFYLVHSRYYFRIQVLGQFFAVGQGQSTPVTVSTKSEVRNSPIVVFLLDLRLQYRNLRSTKQSANILKYMYYFRTHWRLG